MEVAGTASDPLGTKTLPSFVSPGHCFPDIPEKDVAKKKLRLRGKETFEITLTSHHSGICLGKKKTNSERSLQEAKVLLNLDLRHEIGKYLAWGRSEKAESAAFAFGPLFNGLSRLHGGTLVNARDIVIERRQVI